MPGPRGTVVLVTHVDDERTIYGDSLRAHGFDVLIAEGPDHAFDLTIHHHPDVLVTRILQPGYARSGLDLLTRVKELPGVCPVPVLVITSLMQSEVRAEAVERGCDGYLLLPTLPDVLIAEVERLVEIRTAAPFAEPGRELRRPAMPEALVEPVPVVKPPGP